MRVRDGSVPFLDRHVERLVGSCPRANLLPPPGDLAGHARAHALRPPADRILRLEWNGAALVWDDRDLARVTRLRVAVSDVPHPGYPIKSIERTAFHEATARAQHADADEPLLLTAAGAVAETANWAIGWVEGGGLRFPDPALDILPSIGRIRVLELAEARGLTVEVGAFPVEALAGRSLFLVNAVRGVVTVSTLDGAAVPRDPLVGELAKAFWP